MSLVDQNTANVLGAQSDTRTAAIVSEIFITPRNLRLLPSDRYDLRGVRVLAWASPPCGFIRSLLVIAAAPIADCGSNRPKEVASYNSSVAQQNLSDAQ